MKNNSNCSDNGICCVGGRIADDRFICGYRADCYRETIEPEIEFVEFVKGSAPLFWR